MSLGQSINGKVSWFGGPHDAETGNSKTALGLPSGTPGIAVYNHATLGGYWKVTAVNGKSAVLRQTDLGPAPSTGRAIDVSSGALPKLGYSESSFPTNSTFKATYLGSKPPPAGGEAQRSPSSLGKAQSLSPITGFNKEAFQKAQGLAALGKLVSKEGGSSNPLLSTGVLSTTEPTRGEYTKVSLPKVANQARPPANAENGTYRNPFSGDSTVTPERIDQGVDYALRPGEAIKAIGNGVVKGVIPNWFQGQPFVWYELTSGPDAGKSIYVAEQISPTVKAGDRLTAGQTIGTYARSGTGIETGFATPGGGTLASVTGGYSEGQRTSAGDAASKLLASTGAPAGLTENRPTTGDVIAEHNGGKIVKQPKGLTVYYPKR